MCRTSSMYLRRPVRGRSGSQSPTKTTDSTPTITTRFQSLVGHMPFLMEFLKGNDYYVTYDAGLMSMQRIMQCLMSMQRMMQV
ncbi:hypothetical protein DPMN_033298 [Dreissena polymorpha]|uniref:Uncharacterized protein n=1 Tax=Dreissena polymorpha TaxID=45954 RepID=A0A9D4M863_DREPO|nr:hypothetical protein DPMN_033298 [Dreissena polymorpha]